MGIDLIDIHFRIEREFDIALPREVWTDISRENDILVGDLYDELLRRLQLRNHARNDLSLNFALWAHLHDLIHRVTGRELDQVALNTPLSDLFPNNSRRTLWQRLQNNCPYRLPELDYPSWVGAVALFIAATAAAVEALNIFNLAGAPWLWPIAALLGAGLFVETFLKVMGAFSRWRTRFPVRLRTVKDLCRVILATNYEEFCHDLDLKLDDHSIEVWRTLVDILVHALGADEEEITFQSRLIADLGMA